MTRRGLFTSIGLAVAACVFPRPEKKHHYVTTQNRYAHTIILRPTTDWVVLKYNSETGNWIVER